MAIYSGCSHWKRWFSIVMLVYQRVYTIIFRVWCKYEPTIITARGSKYVIHIPKKKSVARIQCCILQLHSWRSHERPTWTNHCCSSSLCSLSGLQSKAGTTQLPVPPRRSTCFLWRTRMLEVWVHECTHLGLFWRWNVIWQRLLDLENCFFRKILWL